MIAHFLHHTKREKDVSMMYEDDYSFSKGYIAPVERILWKGKPAKGNLFSAGDLFMIPFSILWCGFAVFWEVSAIRGGAPFFFYLFGAIFVCAGLYFVFGRFLWVAYLRKHTAYVITNKKIIRKRGKRIDMLSAATMPHANTIIHKNGCGTIRFSAMNSYYKGSFSATGMDMNTFTLENVPDVLRVQQAIDAMER